MPRIGTARSSTARATREQRAVAAEHDEQIGAPHHLGARHADFADRGRGVGLEAGAHVALREPLGEIAHRREGTRLTRP